MSDVLGVGAVEREVEVKKGHWLPPLYTLEEVIPTVDAAFREDSSVPFGKATIVDHQRTYTRLVHLSRDTYEVWSENEVMAREVARILRITPNTQSGEIWSIQPLFPVGAELCESITGLFNEVVKPIHARFTLPEFLAECEAAKSRLMEYNRGLDYVQAMLEEVDRAVAAALSPVR